MAVRPYTRSLHPDDYAFLSHAEPLRQFEREMTAAGVPHREWHEHRLWEYASMMQQLEELGVSRRARIIDVGSGGSFFPPYLVVQGYSNVALTDSMKYGDVTDMVSRQRDYYHARVGDQITNMVLFDLTLEDMSPRPDIGWNGASNAWDVVMCISTIEHVDDHDAAMREMVRVVKPGGYVFITSDYFRDLAHFEQSISRHLQVTPYREDFVLSLPERFGLEFVGETDLRYRGDFVHNYSFVNVCMRKP